MAHHGGGGLGFCIWRPDKTTSLHYKFNKTTKTTRLCVTLLLCRALKRDGQTHGQRDRETETQVKEVLDSGVPPKGY